MASPRSDRTRGDLAGEGSCREGWAGRKTGGTSKRKEEASRGRRRGLKRAAAGDSGGDG